DPDEGIYLADRIIPLSAGPGASLGPAFAVRAPWPRDRRALANDPELKSVRREVVDFLLASNRARPARTTAHAAALPDLQPVDFQAPRRLFGRGRQPAEAA